ncbi:MAG: SLBB domain-containing protein [Colwellia sp.]|nr:SLBB domain-containing protein [Colwellia sp.]
MITIIKKRSIALTLFFFCLVSFLNLSLAAQVSQAQIEQFKRLPASQQQALAKSMGVDINAIKGQLSANHTSSLNKVTPVYTRDTEFEHSVHKTPEPTELEDPEKIKPFGYDVFANAPSTFSPTSDIAIPENYILGLGDSIYIQVFGKENIELELDVNREGNVVFPSHGPFSVAGLSFGEMKRLLVAKIKEKIIGVDVVIGMASLRSMRVFVLGDAYKPGPYTLSSLSSITHALFAAGGISDIGSLRNIQLKRSGKLVTKLDLYDLLIHGDSSNDLMLQSGDVVFIPPVKKIVTVTGLVRRAAIYELIEGETFNDVLNMAGGALPSAYLKYTELTRYSDNSYRQGISLDLTNKAVANKKASSGDEIYIKETDYIRPPKIALIADAITLKGAITKPGKYQWFAGQKIADLLPEIETHVLLQADLQYSIVVRELNKAREIEVLQFSLAKALSDISSTDNLLLKPKDNIIVFTHSSSINEAKKERLVNNSIEAIKNDNLQTEQVEQLSSFSRQRLLLPIMDKLKRQAAAGQPLQLVEVDGEVKYPGIYPLVKNARVDNLISAAGGFQESAYLARAELTRNQIEGIAAKKISKHIELASILKGNAHANILLQSKDRLNVHKIPSWSENLMVELKGEFVFPGRYTIRRGETLSDIIAKAGGFTDFAHQDASVFTRVKLKALEKENLIKLSDDLKIEMASKSLSDTNFAQSNAEVQALLADIIKVDPVGRLVLDLHRVVQKNNYDIMLEGGDVLYVPSLKNSVNVIGQVQVPTSHIYDQGLTADDYLAQSGGSKKRADENRIYIISANGSIKMLASNSWFATDASSSLKPGDTLVVPLDSEYMSNLTLWTSATTIMYNTAVAIAAISGI